MAQLPFRSATEPAAAFWAKGISSIELLDCYLGRIEEFNPGLGAVVRLDAGIGLPVLQPNRPATGAQQPVLERALRYPRSHGKTAAIRPR